jgi:rhamnogalacturonan endolyase
MKIKIKKAMSVLVSLTMCVTAFSFPVRENGAVIKSAAATNVSSHLENLDRGVLAVRSGNGNFVSWRFLKTDTDETTFELYRGDTLVYTSAPGDPTCFWDSGAAQTAVYTVRTSSGSVKEGVSGVWGSGANYWDIFFTPPAGGTSPAGGGNSAHSYTYTANDMSVGDVDGDGQYEYIVKWMPSDAGDNMADGFRGLTIYDCYEMDGTRLWRINMGANIRSGPHYSPFLVYDFDGDGKAEFAVKTADGTTDSRGIVIGDGWADNRTADGVILSGNEYLTVFNGETGAIIDTIDYPNQRGNISDWGDSYGNRSERYLACTADLGGDNLSLVFCRGYYAKTSITALDLIDGKLVQRWKFTATSSSDPFYSQGNHNLAVGDVDFDGKDEIMYGSCAIDDDGTGMYSTGRGHGDAMHLGDFIPNRPGLEVWQIHEAAPYGADLRDAATGEIILNYTADGDTGRGIAGNFVPGNDTAEFSYIGNSDLYDGNGDVVGKWADITKWSQNSAVWWSETLERAVLDRTMVDQYGKGRIFTAADVDYNNGTKSNACLTADLFGDWREEMIFRLADNSGIRIYTTNYETDYRIPTLMHDLQYREQVAHQNVAYNQPPHPSFFLGTGFTIPTISGSGGTVTPITPTVDTFVTPDTSKTYSFKNAATAEFLSIGQNASGVTLDTVNDSVVTNVPNILGFRFVSADDNWYYIQPAAASEFNLDVTAKSTGDGALIKTYTPNGGDNQQFRLLDNGDGTISIITKITDGKSAVTVSDNGVYQSRREKSEYQKWIMDNFEIVSPPTTTSATTTSATATTSTNTSTSTQPVGNLYGDIDLDGYACKITDVILLSKHVSKKLTLPATSQHYKNSDVNLDSLVDTLDLKKVIDVLLGNTTNLSTGT